MSRVLNIGEYAVGNGDEVFSVVGVGSCIVVCLYDESVKAGGMAHILLSSSNGLPYSPSNPWKIGELVIPQMVKELKEKFSAKRIVAKIVGGASLFPNAKLKIGENNVRDIKKVLKQNGIKIAGEDTGGRSGRRVDFYLSTGKVKVRKSTGEEVEF